jgi:hypothetical protein
MFCAARKSARAAGAAPRRPPPPGGAVLPRREPRPCGFAGPGAGAHTTHQSPTCNNHAHVTRTCHMCCDTHVCAHTCSMLWCMSHVHATYVHVHVMSMSMCSMSHVRRRCVCKGGKCEHARAPLARCAAPEAGRGARDAPRDQNGACGFRLLERISGGYRAAVCAVACVQGLA